jgi:hypothetical protein
MLELTHFEITLKKKFLGFVIFEFFKGLLNKMIMLVKNVV